MADSMEKRRRRGPVALGELVSKVLDPVTARRGFATADLMAVWPDIVGPSYAGCTRPERIVWPRRKDGASDPGVLHVKVNGPQAVLVQHELGQIIERVNGFLGYAAVGSIRLIQAPVSARQPANHAPPPLSAREQARVEAAVSAVGDPPLRAALERLGQGILGEQ